MKLQFLTSFFFVLFFTKLNAQKNSYPINLIPENLKVGVNTVIREQKEAVEISSISRMNIKTYKAVTVFNKSGLYSIVFRGRCSFRFSVSSNKMLQCAHPDHPLSRSKV